MRFVAASEGIKEDPGKQWLQFDDFAELLEVLQSLPDTSEASRWTCAVQ